MKNIDTHFHKAKGRSILFLGRFNSLNSEDIKLFLEKFDITYTTTLDEYVAMAVESTILSPLEEEIATKAYQNKIPLYSIDQFDRLYAKELNSDSILMSLKLSNNKQRLFRLLHNTHLNDKLFLKLFSMYDWEDEGMFDTSQNMKIATLFAKRFFVKDRFDPATYHSPVSIFEVAVITKDPDVLEVMFDLPKIKIKQSRSGVKKPTTLKEAIALNPHTNEKTLKKAFRQHDENIDYFLAQNPSLPPSMQEQIFKRGDNLIKESLCKNENLTNELFEKLIDIETLWQYQPIDKKRLQLLKTPPPLIGENENISKEVADLLIEKEDEETLKHLCANPVLTKQQLRKLYELKNENLYAYIAANPNTPTEILHELFEKKDKEIDSFLALNVSTPKEILEDLFSREEFEINSHLALNEALPIEWLQQLQIDHRLLNYLKENRTFTENILKNLGI